MVEKTVDTEKLTNTYIIRHIEDYYKENCKGTFDNYEKELKEKFEILLSDAGEKNFLINNNTVYKSKYYKVVSRVKTAESVSEKLYRNNKILEIINQASIDKVSDLDSCNTSLKQSINDFDDIIGIKILGEVETDVKNIYKLLGDNIQVLEKEKIKLDLSGEQPVPMKNGIDLYKIKGIYKGEYKFELQIKSQLTSAWGDMEHQLFYKDNTYTPIKGSVQPIMNEIGNLIKGIDQLLFTVRTSQNHYEADKPAIEFKNKLVNIYSELIKDYLELPYIDGIMRMAEYLRRLSEVIGIEDIGSINPSHLKLDKDYKVFQVYDENVKNFLKIKKLSFEIQILEYIILSWYKSLNIYKETQETYEESLKKFIQSYTKLFINPDQDIEQREVIEYTLNKFETKSIYLDMDKMKNIIEIFKLTQDILAEYPELNEKYSIDNYIKYISIIYGASIYEQEEIFKSIFESFDNGEYLELTQIYIELFGNYGYEPQKYKKFMEVLEGIQVLYKGCEKQ